ncbi:hypothetical protein BGZ49_001369, partial [Haplosporangium sp. Z 27]
YISLMDLPITALKTEAFFPIISKAINLGGGQTVRTNTVRPLELLFVSSPSAIYQAKSAMEKHVSQMVWFRKLYVYFSRYMSVNELRRVM